MNKLLALAIAASVALGATAATKTATFQARLNCQNCVDRVMAGVEKMGRGIQGVQCNLADKTITVTWDEELNTEENIKMGMETLGVTPKQGNDEQCGNCDGEGHHHKAKEEPKN